MTVFFLYSRFETNKLSFDVYKHVDFDLLNYKNRMIKINLILYQKIFIL